MENVLNKELPNVVIAYNRLLDPIFLTYAEHHPEWKDAYSREKWEPWAKDALLENIEKCKGEWGKYEKQILEGMRDALGIDFYRNVIDVHIVSANPRSISSPIIIRGTFPPLHFVESLTHELVHATQFKDGKYFLPLGDALERPALRVQGKFLKKLKDSGGKGDLESVHKEMYWEKMADDKFSYAYFRNLLGFFNDRKLDIRRVKL